MNREKCVRKGFWPAFKFYSLYRLTTDFSNIHLQYPVFCRDWNRD